PDERQQQGEHRSASSSARDVGDRPTGPADRAGADYHSFPLKVSTAAPGERRRLRVPGSLGHSRLHAGAGRAGRWDGYAPPTRNTASEYEDKGGARTTPRTQEPGVLGCEPRERLGRRLPGRLGNHAHGSPSSLVLRTHAPWRGARRTARVRPVVSPPTRGGA